MHSDEEIHIEPTDIVYAEGAELPAPAPETVLDAADRLPFTAKALEEARLMRNKMFASYGKDHAATKAADSLCRDLEMQLRLERAEAIEEESGGEVDAD